MKSDVLLYIRHLELSKLFAFKVYPFIFYTALLYATSLGLTHQGFSGKIEVGKQ